MSHYEINISLRGHHFFATHERSIRDKASAKRVFAELIRRFPKDDGFEISIVKYETSGKRVTDEFLDPAGFESF